jgi:predicted nuclease of restriction endonuclease-like RecB superfamily
VPLYLKLVEKLYQAPTVLVGIKNSYKKLLTYVKNNGLLYLVKKYFRR